MSAVENWMEGKPIELATSALFLANLSSDVSDSLTEARQSNDLGIDLPPLPEWLSLYTQHRKISQLLKELFSPDNFQTLTEISANPENPQLSSDSTQSLLTLYQKPEVLFFFKVWAPCSIYYNSTPTKLYRRARQGKVSAFEKLLRLDNSIIFDPRLSKLFHQLKGKKDKRAYRKLLYAFGKPITQRSDAKRIKFLIAGLISFISESKGHRLTEPDIRDLFDLISNTKLGMDDQDIPPGHDTFSQAILRERKKWKKFLKPDKR